ncbi:MAG: DUF637 domain-containing protein [Proteobacteria bacterium]|nr:DUF637 domain-containing protein [Pseudomonadota bacterium]
MKFFLLGWLICDSFVYAELPNSELTSEQLLKHINAGLSSTMAGAGFDTLCSEAAVNMIENDGNPGRTLQAMREKNIVKTVARSVTAAGLTGALGVGTAPTSVESFAKEFLARSAVSTTMAIAFDGVKPGDAIRQGALNAAVQTVGACIANKIGDMADSKMGTQQIGDITQEIFHGFLGAGIGAGTAAIMGQDVGKGASSGAIGAVVGHSTAKISGSKALGDLVAVAVAMMTDQDVGIAYMASNNATTYNYAAHQSKATPEAKGDEKEDEEVKQSFLAGLQEGEQNKPTAAQQEYARGRQRYLKESLEQARRYRGRELSDRSRERVIDSASKLFGRYHSSCEALGIMTNPANVLYAASYIPGIPGAIAGVGEAAYGLHKGTHDELDAFQAVVAGARGGLGKMMKGIGNGMSALKKADGRVRSSQGSHHVVDELLTPAHPVTVGGLATKYSGKVGTNSLQPSTSVKSQHFVEMMQKVQIQGGKSAGGGSKSTMKSAVEQPTAQLELMHNVGDRAAFNRKLEALQDLADRGKLFKTGGTMRDADLTKTYRKSLINRAEQQWGATEPGRVKRIKERLLDMDADHLHELQLGGVDQLSALTMLDKSVNRSVGSQLRHQLAQVPEGTKITSVIEKSTAK